MKSASVGENDSLLLQRQIIQFNVFMREITRRDNPREELKAGLKITDNKIHFL